MHHSAALSKAQTQNKGHEAAKLSELRQLMASALLAMV